MWTLLGLAVVEGFITAVSPCVLPVLPVVFAAGSTGGWRRSVAIVAGLCGVFGAATLVGQAVLSAIGLPDDALMDAGIAVLLVLAIGLLVDPIGRLLERPFSRLAVQPRVGASTRSGLVLGAGLGLVYAPCAGPVLTAVVVARGNHRLSWDAVALTAAYVLGAAVPLLALSLFSERLAATWSVVRQHAAAARRVAGAVVGAMAILIATGMLSSLQTSLPGYASSIEGSLSAPTACRLDTIGNGGSLRACELRMEKAELSGLPNLGAAPAFAKVTKWLNTPGGRPVPLSSLRGHVVLVDFWTYSCINCRRSLPHVEAWYREYHKYGFDVIGVHTPEFPFEYQVGNVESAIGPLGVTYPIAVDDAYGTWDAYHNNSWPSEYLVDQNGDIRHEVDYEGDYATTEQDIRLLLEARGATNLPPPTDVPNTLSATPLTEESYLGWYRLNNDADGYLYQNVPFVYSLPSSLPADELGFGGTWSLDKFDAVADAHAVLELSYQAHDVYLVLGGTGTVRVAVDGHATAVLHVHGYPNLYTVLASPAYSTGTVTLDVSRGVRAYDFTFG